MTPDPDPELFARLTSMRTTLGLICCITAGREVGDAAVAVGVGVDVAVGVGVDVAVGVGVDVAVGVGVVVGLGVGVIVGVRVSWAVLELASLESDAPLHAKVNVPTSKHIVTKKAFRNIST
jgi:hypothetical protein